MQRLSRRYGWLRPVWQRLFGARRPRRARFRPACEGLEGRLAPAVTLSVSNPLPLPEGDRGAHNMAFVVTRSGDLGAGVTVDYATQDGTARAGTDYVATSGTLTFAPGQTTATIDVPVIGNTIFQSNRSFTVALSHPLASASFAPQQAFAAGGNSFFVAAADLNGDGRPDLVTANALGGTVSVLLNTTAPGASSPSFADQQTFDTGYGSVAVAAADLNGDGRPDLVIANGVANTAVVLLNATAPGSATVAFDPPQSFVVGTAPSSVAVGDVNGDGRPDLVTANETDGTVSVLLNFTPPGAVAAAFAPQQTFAAGSFPRFAALADVNGDGRPDVVTANYGNDTVSVLLNTTAPGAASAAFAAPQAFAASYGPFSVAAADVNGDGRPDLVTANHFDNSVSVLLNTTAPGASPSFAAQQTFAVGAYPGAVALADMNGDGRPDLVVPDSGGNTVSVLLNETAPGAAAPAFAARQTFATGYGPICVATADVNGDGKPDLIAANHIDGSVSVLLNTESVTPAFTLADQQAFPTDARPTSLALADVNGDGRPDLISVNQAGGTVSVLLNTTAPGAAVPSFAAQQTFAAGVNPYALAVADLNGDGRPDIIFTNEGLNDVAVLLNTTAPGSATASFAPMETFATGGAPLEVAAADVNGDGLPDLITANLRDGTVSVLLNRTAPGATIADLAPQQVFAAGVEPVGLAVGDVNGDGEPDLVVADLRGDAASVLLNTTAPGDSLASFTAPQTLAASSRPISVALADVNGDGRPDFVTANLYGGTLSVFLNETAPGATTPAFAAPQTFSAGSNVAGPISVALADVNGDGKPDLVLADEYIDAASVLLNTTAPGDTTAAFAAAQVFAAGSGPYSLAVGDVNGDGYPDAFIANQRAGTVSVLLNASSTVALGQAVATGTIVDDDAPAAVTAVTGTTPQSAREYAAFPTDLAVTVRNAAGNPVQGVSVTCTAPASGAGGTFAGSATVTTDATGVATAPTFSANATPGSYRVTAAAGGLSAAFDLTNTTPISVTPAGLPGGKVGMRYAQTVAATGGTGPYTYRVTAGALPAGLTLDIHSGLLGGVPRVPGTFHITVSVADSSTGPGPYIAIQSYTLTVAQGNPARLVFLTQPGSAPVNGWLPPFQVLTLDQFGNRLNGVVVRLALVPLMTLGPPGFRAGSVIQATTINGVATFGRVAITTRGVFQLCAFDFPGVMAFSAPFGVGLGGRGS